MAKLGDVIDGKYEVLRLAGEGGMSRVWLVQDLRLNKLWAAKEIGRTAKDASNEVVIQSLIAEANLMKRLDHPALPRIVDIIEDGKTIFVIMDYVEGESLDKTLKSLGHPMSEVDVVDWGIQLCDVLQYLHSQEKPIIYRDMKPANIILRDDNTVKLIDFGIAREYKEDRSYDTQVLGTRGYAAPEQFSKNVQSDVRTDIYSLGVTLHRLVTGRNPLEDTVIRPIRQINPSLSEGLEHIIEKATQLDPNNRYQSCLEMRYDLEHYTQLTKAYRQVQTAKVKKFIRICVFAFIALVLAVASFVISGFLKSSSYDENIRAAQTASTSEEAVKYYLAAIEIEPSDIIPYKNIVDAFGKDDSFSDTEENQWKTLMRNHQSDIENSQGYASLCYEVGMLYFGSYNPGDDSSTSGDWEIKGGQYAGEWFNKAVTSYDELTSAGKSCDLPEKERNAASVLYTVSMFYNISQKNQWQEMDNTYRDFWNALDPALDTLSESDFPMARLTLYQMIMRFMAASDGANLRILRDLPYSEEDNSAFLTQYEAQSMLQKVLSLTKAIESDAKLYPDREVIYNEIIGQQGNVENVIKKVFEGSAASAIAKESENANSNGSSTELEGAN